MGREIPLIFFLMPLIFQLPSITSQNISSTDESSLLALRTLINSDILSTNWTQRTPFCTWNGVTCSPTDSRVTGLNLSNMGLRGTIAREIGNFSFLAVLDITNNFIAGPIPSEIGNLRRLRVLAMGSNRLGDQIPASLGRLATLEELNLSNNSLTGDVPSSLSACVRLKMLDVSHNKLTGNIPAGFGGLAEMQQLIFWNNSMTGELPSTIFNMSSLLTFDVSENQMSGAFPTDICTQPASKLQELWIYGNQFEGQILSALTNCHSLQTISLMGNKFTGNIPNEFYNLSTLQMVGLGRNAFTGTISPSIGNLSNLALFDIAENSFHGRIPVEIGKLSNLTRLNVKSNLLTGEVPQSLYNLSNLGILTLSMNNFSGVLPMTIDKGLPNIEYLILEGNHFHGNIPDSISNLSKLVILDLPNNSFTGVIPITLGNLSQLERLTLSSNRFTNNISEPEQDFLSSLANCKNLTTINIDSNPITGVLPKSLESSNLFASLQQFTARSCRITGRIPEIGNVSSLVSLDLSNNSLSGGLPVGLGVLRNLQKLDLNGNKLEGPILNVFCNLTNMYHVDLSENSFFGELPGCLGVLSKLTEVNLARNGFNSSIPSSLWSNAWTEKMNLSNNLLYGSLSRDIGNMRSLRELDLSGNQISGSVPNSISGLQNLVHLSLANNKMDGGINESFAALKELQYLDLSENSFSSSIPRSLEELEFLTYFNVSFNDLSGEIPDGGPFRNFTDASFVGNKGLCGAPRLKLAECRRKSSRKNRVLIYVLPAIALVVLAAVVLILVLRSRRRKSSTSISDSPPVKLHDRISHHELLSATNSLDEANLIGRGSFGSVYRADFANAVVVAVKVFDLDAQDALKSFDIECRIMSNIRHRNLVKVLTSCSSRNFKSLVMEYMSNGNLQQWLYSGKLNILQRLEIMTDVASAIEYLHEGLTVPIAHCDLKPNNILLDKEMVAHVGDFGIAKLLTREQRMQQTRTLGTVGYMAPEYGSNGLVSSMVDVYSYGILLMEMLTRKKPTDEMFSEELTMRRWVSESFPDSVMQIVDQELLNMGEKSTTAEHASCLISAIKLALDCTTDLPEKRPKMKDVRERTNTITLNRKG